MKSKKERSTLLEYNQRSDGILMVNELEGSRLWRETQTIVTVCEAEIGEDGSPPIIVEKLQGITGL